jgi:hypothetical protein
LLLKVLLEAIFKIAFAKTRFLYGKQLFSLKKLLAQAVSAQPAINSVAITLPMLKARRILL